MGRHTYRVMGAQEVAIRLGVTRQRAYQLTREKGFPDPVAQLAMGKVWDAGDVEEWIRRHRPHLIEGDQP